MKKNKLLLLAITAMSLLFVTCSKEETKKILSKDKTITKVALNISPKVTATVDGIKITASVPFGTDLTAITLSIEHSGASIAPLLSEAQDFSNGKEVKYTVKAEDGTTQDYTVSITVKEPSSNKAIYGLVVNTNPKVTARINDTYKTVTATVPFGTDLTAITLNIEHSGASIAPLLSEVQDFSGGKSVRYTVKAEDGTEQTYTVSISVAEKQNSDKTITKSSIKTPKMEMSIDGIKITATVPFGTDLTAITLNIEHSGASIAPLLSEVQDFSGGKSVRYTVKAEDGTEQTYTVSISVAEKQNSDKTITKASIISPLTEMTIDGIKITASVPFATDLTAIMLNISHNGKSIAPLLSEAQDFSGGKMVTYTVKAEDGTEQTYTVSISVAKELSHTKTITKASIISPLTEMSIDGIKITATVPFGTDLTAITLNIEHSGASIAPLSSEAQDFSGGKSVTYTVKAEDGTEQTYTVSISVAKELSHTKTITKASIISPLTEMSIEGTKITATVPFGTDLTAITLNIEHSGVSIAPLLSEVQDFSGGKKVTYTVKAEDGTEQTYTVSIAVAEKLSSDKTITEASIKTPIITPKVEMTIDDAAKTITATVPFGTIVTAVMLDLKHNGKSIAPAIATSQDFSGVKSVKYIITAQDGTTQEYTVSIDLEETILQSASISAFMGDNASDITISLKPAGNYKLYISNDENCDISNYNNCANAEMIQINGDSKTFKSTTLTTAKEATTYFKIQDSKGSYKIIKKANVFSGRHHHQAVVFNDKMYLIGGNDEIGKKYKNDVYSSSDGTAWKQITTSGTIFSARSAHQAVVFNDKVYVVGGFDNNYKNDVYSSEDGKDWKKESLIGDIFSARDGHRVVVFNDKMYLIGGGNYENDIYSSSDGKAWKKENLTGTIFSARYAHQVVVFKDKMYLIAGEDRTGRINDVYSSEDGVIWNQITSSAAFPGRFLHKVVVFKDKMYLIAGEDRTGRINDVYSSEDGVIWNQITSSAAFTSRSAHQVVVFNNKMFLIGGSDGANKNDVWQSSDGSTWKKALGLTLTK